MTANEIKEKLAQLKKEGRVLTKELKEIQYLLDNSHDPMDEVIYSHPLKTLTAKIKNIKSEIEEYQTLLSSQPGDETK